MGTEDKNFPIAMLLSTRRSQPALDGIAEQRPGSSSAAATNNKQAVVRV